ncbi:MAG TPA: hypothetical protein VLN56_03145 [Gammaproteobacteria bacterium]|nr:hypothetical protein [Gammaproteobacteria bacterium]
MKYLYPLFLLIAYATAGHAADKNGQYAIWGLGAESCHKYNLAREADDVDDYKNYIMGFFTAYNIITPETYRISGDMDLDAVLGWFDDECGLKPIISFEEALTNYLVENYDKRLDKAPTSFRR